jgi:hypothetical protein
MIKRYELQFGHKDWIDNQDRVQAGGEDGLNDRFHRLEAEFAGLADNQINPIIEALAKRPTHLTLIPALIPYRKPGANATEPAWNQNVDGVEKPQTIGEAHGFMNVVLPDGAQVTSLLMTGLKPPSATGTLRTVLKARHFANEGAGSVDLITAEQLGVAAAPTGGEAVTVTNATQRYSLLVEVTGAGASDVIKVFCVQLTYQ